MCAARPPGADKRPCVRYRAATGTIRCRGSGDITVPREASEKVALDERSIAAIAGLGITQIIGWGSIFTPLTVVGTMMTRDLGLPREIIFGGITLSLIITSLMAAHVGRAIDRYGARWFMVTGSFIAGMAMLATAHAEGLWTYALAWVLVGLAAPLMLHSCALPALVAVVGENARPAITALMLLSGLASTVFLQLTSLLADAVGWRGTYIVYAALQLSVCLVIHIIVLRPRSGMARRNASTAPEPQEGVVPANRRRAAFVLLAIWACSDGFISWGINLQIIDIFVAAGLSASVAVAVWSCTGLTQVVSRFCELLLNGRYSIWATALAASCIMPVGYIVIISLGVTPVTSLILAITFGISHGLFVIARGTLPLMLFGRREYGTYMGLLMVPQSIVNASAPIIVAAVFTRFDPIYSLWFGCAATLLVFFSALALYRYCRTHTREEELQPRLA